jgi:hypothetical protein
MMQLAHSLKLERNGASVLMEFNLPPNDYERSLANDSKLFTVTVPGDS